MTYFFIYRTREQEGGTGPAWGLVPVGGGGGGERMKEGEYGANIASTCTQMEY
jgi:hypothetical protein